jgi:hypothetical protein
LLGVLVLAAGGAALFVPSGSGRAVTRVLGLPADRRRNPASRLCVRADRPAAVVSEILLAMLYEGVGCLLLVKPAVGLQALTVALVPYLVLGGTLEITLGFALGPLPGCAWLVIDGVVFLRSPRRPGGAGPRAVPASDEELLPRGVPASSSTWFDAAASTERARDSPETRDFISPPLPDRIES